jgi:hypothetical protein
MEAEKWRWSVYRYSPRHGPSNQKRGPKAQETSVEIASGVHRVRLSSGDETRFLDRSQKPVAGENPRPLDENP